jgi:hypothetical protein
MFVPVHTTVIMRPDQALGVCQRSLAPGPVPGTSWASMTVATGRRSTNSTEALLASSIPGDQPVVEAFPGLRRQGLG